MDYITTTLSNINLEESIEKRFDNALPYYILQINPSTKKLINVYIDLDDLKKVNPEYDTNNIISCINGIYGVSNGFIWIYKKNFDTIGLENLTDEEWKLNSNYPGYIISSLGRIISPFGRYLKLPPAKDGYVHFIMKINEKPIDKSLHRIIAETFLENPDNKPVVNHINGIRHDCRVNLNVKYSNLEWVTVSENNQRKVFKSTTNNGTIEIEQYDKDDNLIKTWRCATDLIKETKFLCIYKHLDIKSLYKDCYWKRKQVDNLEGEEWKYIYYGNRKIDVSNMGRIKDLNGRIHIGSENCQGYMTYNACDKHFLVHRLVMLSFNFNEDHEKFLVNHIDCNKQNNKLENLEWCTVAQNNQHARDNKLVKSNAHVKSVDQFDLRGNFIKTFPSIIEASKQNMINNKNIEKKSIGKCCNNKQITAGGFIWKFHN